MFGKSFKLFEIFGFEIKVDLSWTIIAVLVTWSLAQGLFPHYYENLSTATYWYMGIAGALGFFASIVLHELAHSVVANRLGIPMKGITLFIFGGVAEMSDEPPSAKSEFMVAIAGPIMSVAIGLGCYLLDAVGSQMSWSSSVSGVIGYLAFINLLLAGFNMIPAFPLDGGRILRAALWAWKDNSRWATRIASSIGSGFGAFLILLGVVTVIYGNFIQGIWWGLIGLFLRSASQMSYQQLLIRNALRGETIDRFMKQNPVTVPADTKVDRLVEDYVYNHHFKMFPVVENGKLVGCVSVKQIKDLPKQEWSQHAVRELSVACSDDNTVKPDEDAMKALSTMRRSGNSRLIVTRNGELAGVVALKDMLEFLALKVDLDDV